MVRILILLTATLACMAPAHARRYVVSPENPTAMEFVHLQSFIGGECERFRNVEPIEGGFRVNMTRLSLGLRCDEVLALNFTLGAFAPGTYRITTRVTCVDCSPPVFDETETTTFTVSPGVASSVPGDDTPSLDFSGIWTSPNEPFTGLAFIDSGGVGANGRRDGRITGIWYDYSGAQPTWSLLLLGPGPGPGQIVRAMPTGTGTNRTITLAPVGTATLTGSPIGNPNASLRLTGTIDGRAFDLMLERFRWTRSAWPSRAADPQ